MDILGIFGKATKLLLEVNTISVDNWAFKMYYKVTTLLIVLCTVLVTSRQFFGSPIQCDAGTASSGVRDEVLESYCWMYAHFNIPEEYEGPCSGKDQSDMEGPIYNSYYQWVSLFLLLVAVLFYVPRMIWMMMEGGLMKFFGKGTTTRLIEEPDEKRDKLVQFFTDNIHNKYNIYYFGFICCEMLNTLIVIIAYFLTDRFLNYEFAFYGFKTWLYYKLPPEEQRMSTVTNPMCKTFPRIAACDYHRFGSGGGTENVNAICILALNIINDKVFLVLWWWYFLLLWVGIIRLVFRIIQINSSRMRFYLLKMRMNRYFRKNDNMKKIHNYICKCSRGDWFVLYQLSKNLNRPFFMDFLTTLARNVDPDPETPSGDNVDEGDGIMDMMLKPALQAYESQDGKKDNKSIDEEED